MSVCIVSWENARRDKIAQPWNRALKVSFRSRVVRGFSEWYSVVIEFAPYTVIRFLVSFRSFERISPLVGSVASRNCFRWVRTVQPYRTSACFANVFSACQIAAHIADRLYEVCHQRIHMSRLETQKKLRACRVFADYVEFDKQKCSLNTELAVNVLN